MCACAFFCVYGYVPMETPCGKGSTTSTLNGLQPRPQLVFVFILFRRLFFPLCLCARFPLWFSDLSFNLFARSWCVASLTHGRSSTTEAIYSALVFCHFLVILPKYCSCICIVKPLQHFAIVVSGLQSFQALSDGGGHGHHHRHRQSQHQ